MLTLPSPLQRALGLGAVAFLLSSVGAHAQATFSGTYNQNFDGMGSGTTAPTGWSAVSEAGSHDTFSPSGNPSGTGVLPNLTSGSLTTVSLVAGTPGTQKSTSGYNFAATGLTGVTGDRALGTSPSGNAATILELSLTNSTGSAISALSLSYDIDRFTTTAANNSDYASSPTVGVEENPGYNLYFSLNGGTSWTAVSSLNPTLAGPGGVVVPNSTGVTNVSDPLLNLGGSWAAGGNLRLAWIDDNAQSPSPDQLLGLNNVSISVAAAPEPSSGLLGVVAAFGAAALLRFRRMRA